MQFLQAKVKNNKLGVQDTYPIAIDSIEFFKGSIVIYVTKRNGGKDLGQLQQFREVV